MSASSGCVAAATTEVLYMLVATCSCFGLLATGHVSACLRLAAGYVAAANFMQITLCKYASITDKRVCVYLPPLHTARCHTFYLSRPYKVLGQVTLEAQDLLCTHLSYRAKKALALCRHCCHGCEPNGDAGVEGLLRRGGSPHSHDCQCVTQCSLL